MFKKYSKFIYIIIGFYIVWLALLPLTCNLLFNAFLPKDIKKLQIRTSVLPNITIKAEEISLPNSPDALNIKQPKINIKILPLLVGKVQINRVSANSINANFIAKDKLYLGNFEIPELNFDKTKFDPNKLKINNINIKEYKITLLENGRVNKFEGKNFKYKNTRRKIILNSKSSLNTNCTLDFDLNLPKTNKENKSKCNISVKNLDLKDFSPLVSSYFKEIKSTNGKINITSNKDKIKIKIEGLNVLYNDDSYSIKFPQVLTITSNFRIYNNILDIKNAVVKANGLHTTASGKIRNVFSSSPKFELKTNIEHVDLRKGALMLPNIITEDISTPALKKYAFYGDMTGNIEIKGELPTPDITGAVAVRNGMLIKPIKNAKGKANIDIKFVGQKLILDVDVPAGDNEWVTVDGDIAIYGEKFAHLNIKSSDSVDLDTAEFVVNPLHEIFRFEVGPVPIMDIKGRGNATLKIVGTKKDPHIWGLFNFKNTGARFLEVNNLVLEHASGILEFKDQIAYFINKTGTVHGKPATIEGTCTLFGDLDFNVTTKNQKLSDLITIFTTSKMLDFMKQMVPELKDVKGNADFFLNLKGEKVMHIADLKINDNIIPQGTIKLHNNSFIFENLKMHNTNGLIKFYKTDCDININSKLSKNSNITVKGILKDGLTDIKISTPKIVINELNIKELKFLDTLAIKLDAKYKGGISKIDLTKIDAKIDVLKNNLPVKNCKVTAGQIILKNSNLKINNLTGFIKQNPFYINGTVKNLDKNGFNSKKSTVNGVFRCKDLDLTALNSLKSVVMLPADLQAILNNITVIKGVADIDLQAKNNNLNSIVKLNNIDFTYSIKEGEKKEVVDIPVKLINGQIILRNKTVTLKKLNCLIDEMPILVFGKVDNIYKNPKYNIYINSKLVQKVFTKYWNAYNIYPIKVNGDIVSTVRLSGDKQHTHINSETRMEENSEIYYMGANIGDSANPITLKFDTDLYGQNLIKLNKFSYNKVVSSQNNKENELPLLNISGEIRKKGNTYYYKNLAIKSENPADASLFNIIFKKPTIKQGTFVSDLKINGNSQSPKILGKFNLANVEMPYLNTSVKELTLDFKPNTINVVTKGEVMSNYIMGSVEVNNVLTPPYTINNAYLYINSLDVNHLMSQIKQLELKGISSAIATDKDVQTINVLNMFRIKSAKIRAGQILVKNITASNLEATCGFDKKKISIESFNFNMANGIISGNLNFNLKNNFMNLSLSANKVNANTLTTALFDLPNQIYGDLTGRISISCDVTNEKTQHQTFSGHGGFNVANGKMPKLGSLEYLLKAGNLLRGGLTSISMNSIIDIVTPLKTGEFSSINGHFDIKNGIAQTVEIHSHSKNLNLYITGTYNFIESIANMNVYGQISRKVSTVLGAAGNISLNTLFNKIPGVSTSQFVNDLNKIPGIDLSNKSSRKFVVEILGDINGEDFVKSFRWLN